MRKQILAKDLLKTRDILQAAPQDTLIEALTKLSRTHDAIFVFDNDKKFLGVISPYYALFKSNYPPNTKVNKALYSPPKLDIETPLQEISRLMTESKVYFLPVIDQEKEFKGIVTINRILKTVLKNNLASKMEVRRKKPLIAIHEKASLADAFNRMKDKRVARLPVVNSHKHLKGIVSRHDIRLAISEPQESPRYMSREGNKNKLLNEPLNKYYQKLVVTADPATTTKSLIKKVLDKKVGSVIIVNQNRTPVGIVTNYDLLKAIQKL